MEQKNNILIFTSVPDPHTDDLVNEIASRGYDVFRLNTNEIPINIRINASINDKNKKLFILSNGRTIYFDKIKSVWVRRPGQFIFPEAVRGQEKNVAISELRQVLFGLLFSMKCYWISHPSSIENASWKPEQLVRAQKFGFNVPKSLIASNKTDVSKYFDFKKETVVYKMLSSSALGVSETLSQSITEEIRNLDILTKVISFEELQLLDELYLTPSLFQECLQKKFEYRVTIVGRRAFVVKFTPKFDFKDPDWRRYMITDNMHFEVTSLPHDVLNRCLSLVDSYDLHYASIDLAQTQSGDLYFLEINPSGQFRYLDMMIPELGILDHMCDCLMHGGDLV